MTFSFGEIDKKNKWEINSLAITLLIQYIE